MPIEVKTYKEYLADEAEASKEAMMAARDLEDTLFPDLHIEQEFLKLAKEV